VIFDEEIGRSFAMEALDAGRPPRRVSLLPSQDDFLAEIHTRRYGRLAYVRLASEPEDVTLVERGRRLVVYPSKAHRATTGFTYGDEYGLPYEVSHYDIEAEIDPARLAMAGRTRVHLHALDTLETVTLRLDRGLVVSRVQSAEQGVHQFLQPPKSDTLLVRSVPPLTIGQQIVLEVTYRGAAKPQELGRATTGDGSHVRGPYQSGSATFGVGGPTDAPILYSNHVYWFPQSPVRNHTTASLRVEVPSGFTVVASARLEPPSPVTNPSGTRTFKFRTEAPVRYVALLVGRLAAVDEESSPGMTSTRGVAAARLVPRGRVVVRQVADMVRFFSSFIGDVPFSPVTAAIVEVPVPAAHSPAYLAILGEPRGWNPATAGDDPAYFAAEPQFFLAHEVAHQWWGQAVGWRNYREQWLSEAFAQYFAALYIQHTRGEEAFAGVLAWMRRWALSAAGKGPINLGIRAGQVTGTPRDFVPIAYDRGAYVLHMLRGLLGDDVFFRALRTYYERWRFRRAGTDDFRGILEDTSGLNLGRFFEQWVRDDGLPDLEWTAEVVSLDDRRRLRVRLRQIGEAFELPLQVRIDYLDRPSTTERVRVSLAKHEYVFDLQGRFARVRLNADLGALCQLHEQH
jgi:aminopeptidase N